MTRTIVRCRVCFRPLRSLISIAQGVGPVCRNKVAAAMQELLDQVRRGEVEPVYQDTYALAPDELQSMVEQDVRRAYLEQIRQRRRPSINPVAVQVESASRGGRTEEVTIQWIDRDHAHVHSASGHIYTTTDQSCTCPHYVYRLSRDPELVQEGCRHIQALRLARDEVREQRRLARQQRRAMNTNPVVVHEENRITFSQIDWTEED